MFGNPFEKTQRRFELSQMDLQIHYQLASNWISSTSAISQDSEIISLFQAQ